MSFGIALAERIIEAACRKAVADGHVIGDYEAHVEDLRTLTDEVEMCPLQAVAVVLSLVCANDAADKLELAWFVEGYDGDAPANPEYSLDPSYLLGKKFRDRVRAGEFAG